MPAPRRMWDSSVVLAYLAGYKQADPVCDLILNEASLGRLEIVVSTLAEAEVAYLQGKSDTDSEATIQEFFSRDYIVPVSFDRLIAREARRLIRCYRPGLQGADAVHIATALKWHIPVIESFDPHFLKLNGKEGNPPVIIREPLYEGPIRLL